MANEAGRFRALPEISDELHEWFVSDQGPIQEWANVLGTLDGALGRADEDLEGLTRSNPNLAGAVRGTVEGMYGALADQLQSEQAKAWLRAGAYANAFVLLRLIDMQLRRSEGEAGP